MSEWGEAGWSLLDAREQILGALAAHDRAVEQVDNARAIDAGYPPTGYDHVAHLQRARDVVESAGYVVLRRKSYEDLRRRLDLARAQVGFEHAAGVSMTRWARDEVAERQRLADRCTFLYGAAIRAGATPEDLAKGLTDA